MKVTFSIHYIAAPDETLHLVSCNDAAQWPMKCSPDNMWEVTITVKEPFAYRYCAKCGANIRWEEGEAHNMAYFEGFNRLRFVDAWHELDESRLMNNWFESTKKRECGVLPIAPKPGNAFLRVYAPGIGQHQELFVLGSGSALGYWDVDKAISMNAAEFPYWTVVFPLHQGERVEYKFVIKTLTGELVAWEPGNNHVLLGSLTAREATVVNDLAVKQQF